jgi:hypothetical protein
MKLDPDQKEPFGDGVEFIKKYLVKRYEGSAYFAGGIAGMLVKKFAAAGQLNLTPDEWQYILDKEFKTCHTMTKFILFVQAFDTIDPDGTRRRTLAQKARKHVGGVTALTDGVMAKAELLELKRKAKA